MLPIVTFTTDFGTRDGFVAQMKGVVLGRAPGAILVDVTHDIEPFSVLEGALVMKGVVRYFPWGTIHIGVVDPGVGGSRREVAVMAHGQLFVGPDNGLFSLLLLDDSEGEIRKIDQPELILDDPHPTFHGRDVFAPVAAALATGFPFEALGPLVTDPVLLSIPRPEETPEGIAGEIVCVDRFGNLSSNVDGSMLTRPVARVTVGDAVIHGISKAFSQVPEGNLVAVINSFGLLEIAVNRGNAAQRLSVGRGEPVRVVWD
jgi:S-adenosyl-L-methionine hydrolase (adenosine-forming)